MWQAAAARRYGIALDLGDLDLRDALAEALAAQPALRLAAEGGADAVISDRAAPGPRVLRLAGGPLPSDAAPELILAAAHLVAAGLRVEPGEAAADPGSADPEKADPAHPGPGLSPREREVLGLMVEGAPNKAIARSLGIAVRTAKFHVAAVLAKLGARNRSEAVAIALREGLVLM